MSDACAWIDRRCESVDAALTLAVEHGLCADRNETARSEREDAESVRAKRGLAKLLGEKP